MAKVRFQSGKDKDREKFAKSGVLVVAVDLGFSNKSRSCGIAWGTRRDNQSVPLRFGDAVKKIVSLIGDNQKAVLIIEAPLSATFDVAGNPISRGPFEKNVVTASEGVQVGNEGSDAKSSFRYWYYGSGAAMCLASIFFLRELTLRLVARKTEEIVLFEGFVSFKSPKNAVTPEASTTEGSPHAKEACQLLKCFLEQYADSATIETVKKPANGKLIAVTSILDRSGNRDLAPAIIIPSK